METKVIYGGKTIRQCIYELINEEREKQDKKWGVQIHDPETWLTILVEEVGELASSILFDASGHNKKHRDKDMVKELIQVMAVAVVMMENGLEEGRLLLPRTANGGY